MQCDPALTVIRFILITLFICLHKTRHQPFFCVVRVLCSQYGPLRDAAVARRRPVMTAGADARQTPWTGACREDGGERGTGRISLSSPVHPFLFRFLHVPSLTRVRPLLAHHPSTRSSYVHTHPLVPCLSFIYPLPYPRRFPSCPPPVFDWPVSEPSQ